MDEAIVAILGSLFITLVAIEGVKDVLEKYYEMRKRGITYVVNILKEDGEK